MSNVPFTVSPQGIQQLKKDEGSIDGVYDDPSGYCTSGVGHLVHKTDKWPSFLLAAVRQNPIWKKRVAHARAIPYLPMPTAFDQDFGDIKAAALTLAREAIAKRRHRLDYSKLTQTQATNVNAQAQAAIDGEATALSHPTEVTLRADIRPCEAAVRSRVTVDSLPVLGKAR
jgi:hypothetical protein